MEQKNQNIESQYQTEGLEKHPIRVRAYSTIRKILIGFILISIVNAIFSQLFYTPKIHNINKKNNELAIKYNLLNNRIAASQSRLSEISHRDIYVYRSLFGVDSVFIEQAQVPYPESKYEKLQNSEFSPMMTSTWKKMDRLAKNLYTNSISMDELQRLAQNKESMSAALPAIWPIDRTQLRNIGHFGMRHHPIYKRSIMHKGIDLSCDRGTPVFATADGVIEKSVQGERSRGYGQEILINHEYSYKTRYGHLSKRHVQRGDTVRRGQLIGEVGSTGGSTSSHLHYEVIYKGNPINPINYFDRNMTNEEYTQLMEEMNSVDHEFIVTDSLEYGN
ncbi:MAG: M23 family metallopeptidase [Rikenellaceae bacterium]